MTGAELRRSLIGAAAIAADDAAGGPFLREVTCDLVLELVELDLVDELVSAVAALACNAAEALAHRQRQLEEVDGHLADLRAASGLGLVQARLLAEQTTTTGEP